MEIKLGPLSVDVGDDGVSSVVTSGATGADVGLSSEDVDQLALAFASRETRSAKGAGSESSRRGMAKATKCSPSSPHWAPRTTRTPSGGAEAKLIL